MVHRTHHQIYFVGHSEKDARNSELFSSFVAAAEFRSVFGGYIYEHTLSSLSLERIDHDGYDTKISHS